MIRIDLTDNDVLVLLAALQKIFSDTQYLIDKGIRLTENRLYIKGIHQVNNKIIKGLSPGIRDAIVTQMAKDMENADLR